MLRRLLSGIAAAATTQKIYTKKGDFGLTTTLKDPRRLLPKSDSIFRALGDNDELTSLIGCHCNEHPQLSSLSESLLQVQKHLQNLNSHLATPKPTCFDSPAATAALEAQIDAWSAELPRLEVFLLPGGCEAAATLHVARAVCRRAERSLVGVGQDAVDAERLQAGIVFMNRLSDYLFTAARYANMKLAVADVPFK